MDDETIRLYLQTKLEETFSDLTVYYRPSGNIILNRPCIIYEPKASQPSYAGNLPYVVGTRFQITILSDLPGYPDKRKMFSIDGVTVYGNNTYTNLDVVHDVFTVLVNTIT